MEKILEQLITHQTLDREALVRLMADPSPALGAHLADAARKVCEEHYGTAVFTRGLIEFTNCCRNDCLYCGIRRSNRKLHRYRLNKEQILACTDQGYALGFRTFVLQGGEDPWFTVDRLEAVVAAVHARFPDCAITLSVGERPREDYERFYAAGADRFLLRHETADDAHYRTLHPREMDPEHRKACLYALKAIGYQVGTGFMVGSPGQTVEHLVSDLLFIQALQPAMIGIGPFIPHRDTPFRDQPPGTLKQTLKCISVLRLMNPKALIPATTALGTIDPTGREQGILAGANVVMPNLSPVAVRGDYSLYDNKICTGEEAAECRDCLAARMKKIGRTLAVDRGDAIGYGPEVGGSRHRF